MITKKLFLLLNFILVAFMISACGNDESVAQASPDETADTCTPDPNCIIVYTAQGEEDYLRHLQLFQQQFPHIKVQVERASTGIISDRILAEKISPRADVIWALATTSLLRAAAEGILEPYAPQGLFHPNDTPRVHPRARHDADPPLFVGIDIFMSAFCVNTELLAQKGLPVPASWADLTNPIYKDQIIMPDPGSSGTGFIAVAAYLEIFGQEDEKNGWHYLDALHQNIVLYTRSGSEPCKLAGEGQIPIGISFGKRGIDLRDAGRPVVTVFPQEGSGWELEANALVRKNSIKNSAKTFLDWAISDSAMQSYAHIFPLTSVETDVPIPEGYAPKRFEHLLRWSFFELTANHDRIIEEWTNRYGEKSELVGAELPQILQ